MALWKLGTLAVASLLVFSVGRRLTAQQASQADGPSKLEMLFV